ncbi:MAG: cobyrinate a,c-diamide synthase [Methanomicrobiales archaeon]|nr:cobyrinate a,c-diamide synthase [Methanomicrobiales archaeon]
MTPALLIAGTHSGCGKTTVACGIMAALTARGLRVQPFKVGPDFIDPSHHSAICGRPSRNLDPFMMGEEEVVRVVSNASEGADVVVIEGVMGMFDGLGGTTTGSTAHVARILSLPVILVVDVGGMSRSAHAVIQGFRTYDPAVRVGGVIFNRVGSGSHRTLIEHSLTVPAYGWICTDPARGVRSRHLGLLMAREDETMQTWGPVMEEQCALDALLRDAICPRSNLFSSSAEVPPQETVRVGVARDAAFCFYYQENLDRLVRRGGSLVYFSPLSDRLPEVDLLYLGGGYPELHAEVLSSSSCTTDIRRAADDGMPILAECGGLTYLCRTITTDSGEHRMADILPADATMHSRFRALGYVEASATGASPLLPPTLAYRGHEFHYSALTCDTDARFAVQLSRGKGIRDGKEGLMDQNVVGTYSHAYFTDAFADALLSAGRRGKKR